MQADTTEVHPEGLTSNKEKAGRVSGLLLLAFSVPIMMVVVVAKLTDITEVVPAEVMALLVVTVLMPAPAKGVLSWAAQFTEQLPCLAYY